MRLIDADWLASKLRRSVACMERQKWPAITRPVVIRVYRDLLNKLDKVPTVDAAPVVHARWDVIEDDFFDTTTFVCNNCGEELTAENDNSQLYPFCPHCGAKMDEEDE